MKTQNLNGYVTFFSLYVLFWMIVIEDKLSGEGERKYNITSWNGDDEKWSTKHKQNSTKDAERRSFSRKKFLLCKKKCRPCFPLSISIATEIYIEYVLCVLVCVRLFSLSLSSCHCYCCWYECLFVCIAEQM